MPEKRKELLTRFVEWVSDYITGDEKSQAQIYLDRLFIALGHKGCLDVGGTPEFRIRKPKESGGGVAFGNQGVCECVDGEVMFVVQSQESIFLLAGVSPTRLDFRNRRIRSASLSGL